MCIFYYNKNNKSLDLEHIWSVTDSLKMKRCVQFGKITVLYCTVFTVHSIIAFTVMELWAGSVSYNSE